MNITPQPQTIPVSLLEIITKACASLRDEIDGSHAKIDIPQDLSDVPGNPMQLTRLFQCILTNALMFRSHAQPHVTVAQYHETDHVTIELTDNGIGIAAEYHRVIFDVFRRLHTWERYPGGCGIGLAISKKIVELHRGSMGVRSELGAGATFYITLPLENSR